MLSWSYRDDVEFSVLGPLLVMGDGQPIEIRGAKERTLLAILVSRAGQVVSTHELVDALWGDNPPRTAAKSLQTHVLRLRNMLEPHRMGRPRLIVTEGQGYRLVVEPGQVDATRFVRLVDAAQRSAPQAALEPLREALELWRGPAYAGLDSAAPLAADARRLEEVRLVALEGTCAAELEVGRHDHAIAELERLVTEHPLRERLWGLLMTGLYRAGRQADALGAFERARQVLAEDLGIDPGPELRSLQARVLAQDAALGQARPTFAVPQPLVATSATLYGRTAELAVLRGAWHAAQEGESQNVQIRGPVGSGARRLAAALAEQVTGAGAPVVYVGRSGRQPSGEVPAGPLLVVLDRVDGPAPDAQGLALWITGPDAATIAGAMVLDLGPLDAAALRELVSDYVAGPELERVAEQVHAESGGWPAAAHASAFRYVRDSATATVRAAVTEADVSRASLHDARERLASGVFELQRSLPAEETEPSRCPWRGLRSYEVSDAPWFAGRERLVAELVARCSGSSCLAVLGASGSGKSSVVRAGLLAGLADGQLPGSAAWRQLVMRPGQHPMRELARRVLGAPHEDAGAILERLVRAESHTHRTVLVVDQFEETWTACLDQGEREAFLDTLAEVALDIPSAVTLILVLRADYLDRLADHPTLAGLVGDNTVLVGTPTPDEVRRAVERPARRGGVEFDDGLVDAIVSDAGAEPGLLPLLSTTMTELWESRSGRRLTFTGYVAMGGLRGAIGHLAERAYTGLEEPLREVAQSLLLRLTGPGEGTAVTRRRVNLSELAGLPQAETVPVVERLAEARLLTLSGDHVEAAHEALFQEWPRLRTWLAEDAAGRAVQQRLTLAAGEWHTEHQESTLLWRGTRLESGLEVADVRPEEITAVERAFLDAGRAAADADRQETERRAAEKARQNRRLKSLLVGTAVLLALALVTGIVAVAARGRARDAARQAADAAVAADARRLAASALSVEDPDLALLAAVESTRLEKSPETYGAVLTLLARQPDVVTRFHSGDWLLQNAASPDGKVVYVSERGPVLRALDAETGDQLWARDDLAGMVGAIAPAPDGEAIAVTILADVDDTTGVSLLDADNGHEIRKIPLSAMRAVAGPHSAGWLWYGLGWTADGRLVFASDSHIFLADGRGRLEEAVPWGRRMLDSDSLRVWPDGRVSSGDSVVNPAVIVDLSRPNAPARKSRGTILALSPDGSRAVAIRDDETGQTVLLVDAHTLRPRSQAYPVEGTVRGASFSPDGDRFALGADEELQIRDGRTAAPLDTLLGHSGVITSLAYTDAKSDLIWTTSRDGTAVAFDTTGQRGVLRTAPMPNAPHSGETATGSDTAIWTNFHDVAPNRAFLRLPGERRGEVLPLTGLEKCLCQAASTDLTPDGTLALAGYQIMGPLMPIVDRGYLLVWDSATRSVRSVVDTPWPVIGVAVNADGTQALLNGTGGWGVLDLDTRSIDVTAAPDVGYPPIDGTATVELSPDGDRAALLRRGRVVIVDARAARSWSTVIWSSRRSRCRPPGLATAPSSSSALPRAGCTSSTQTPWIRSPRAG